MQVSEGAAGAKAPRGKRAWHVRGAAGGREGARHTGAAEVLGPRSPGPPRLVFTSPQRGGSPRVGAELA